MLERKVPNIVIPNGVRNLDILKALDLQISLFGRNDKK
jgi:hypothetical protein